MEEIAKDLYRIPVPLAGPLRELNSYFIRGGERDLLIDTGFRTPECREALEAGLRRLGSRRERRDVLVTHFHTDHAGLADLAADVHGKIYMSPADAAHDRQSGKLHQETVLRFRSEGFDEERLSRLLAGEAGRMAAPEMGERLTLLEPHQRLTCGGYTLEHIPVPGHTPGSMMLWAERQGIMFCGDHILFDISPNITPAPGAADSLGDYMASLRRAAGYPVRLALPGHRGSGDYHRRIAWLLEHHEKRLAQVRRIAADTPGLCALEIARRMDWNIRADGWDSFPIPQQWFAMGECLAHLDHLRASGEVVREWQRGLYRYYSG